MQQPKYPKKDKPGVSDLDVKLNKPGISDTEVKKDKPGISDLEMKTTKKNYKSGKGWCGPKENCD